MVADTKPQQRKKEERLRGKRDNMEMTSRHATTEGVLGAYTPAFLLKRAKVPFFQGNAKLLS